jgi:hypothetical protein
MATIIEELAIALGWQVDAKPLTDASEKSKRQAKETSDAWKKSAADVGKAFLALGAAAAGAAVGIFKLVEGATKSGDEIAKGARAAGIAADSYQRLQFIAGRSGVEMNVVSVAARKLAKNLLDASTGGGKLFTDTIRSIGLSLDKLQGQDPDVQIGIIADALMKVEDPARRGAMSMNLFGEEGGPKMASLLALGSKGMKDIGDKAKALGLIMGKDALDASEEFTDELSDLKATMKGLARDLGIELVPMVRDLVTQFREWIVQNRELIQTKLKAFIDDLVKAITAAVEVVKAIADGFLKFSDAVGGTGNAVKIMIGLFATWKIGGLISDVATLAKSFVTLAGEIGKTTVATRLLSAARLGLPVAALAAGVGAAYMFAESDEAHKGKAAAGLDVTNPNVQPHAALLQSGLLAGVDKTHQQRTDAFGSFVDGMGAEDRAAQNKQIERGFMEAELYGLKNASKKRALKPSEKTRLGELAKMLDISLDKAPKGEKKIDTREVESTGLADELRHLGGTVDAHPKAITAAIEAAASSMIEGASFKVAREAGLGRLGSMTGTDFMKKREADPILSAIFGDEGQPDIALSELDKGQTPQVLISTINNNFTQSFEIPISGAGEPGSVADSVVVAFKRLMSEDLQDTSKMAKVVFNR